jgi:hypothetical protein
VLGNARYLQQFHSPLDVNIQSTSKKLTKLIIPLLPTTLFALPAIAIEPTSNTLPKPHHLIQESEPDEELPTSNFLPSLSISPLAERNSKC